MSANSVALPRIRTKRKRKKRKPPRPQFWVWAFMFAVYVATIVDDVFGFLADNQSLAWFGVDVTLYYLIVWPNFIREWRLWRRDDDE